MNNKVVIVGCGNVGMSYAYALINQNTYVTELVLVDILKDIFGIHSIVVAYKVNTNTDIIKEKVLEVVKEIDFNTFNI